MAAGDHDLVNRLLRQSILTLCREAVAYRGRLEVDGIVCLTVDDRDQHVVKIHEFFDRHKSGNTANDVESRVPLTSLMSTYVKMEDDHDGKHGNRNQGTDEQTARTVADSELLEKQKIGQPQTGRLEDHLLALERNDKMKLHTVPLLKSDVIDLSKVKQEPRDFISSTSQDSINEDSIKVSNTMTTKDYKKIGLDNVTISSATNIMCKKCDTVADNVSVFEAHNMSTHGHFTCLICLSTFTSRNNMKRHIRLHTGIKPYSCHKCPESFSRNDDFKRHLLKHTFQKPFRCAVCKTGYSDRTCVKSHMLKEHNTSVFHVCPQCGETFIDLYRFQQHKKRHPEFEDFRCSVCSFTGSNALMYHKHMLTHGPSKEYRCTHCEINFHDPFSYTSHLKRHKGDEDVQDYICCFCEIKLPTFEQFQRHEHTHVHPKQHVCHVCKKVFRYPSNLREHMVTHISKSDLLGSAPDIENVESHETYNESREFQDSPVATDSDKHSSVVDDDSQMEIEENNNQVDAKIPDEESEGDSSVGNDVSGSSEYWCTECNQGFGTEHELQDHILSKHEAINNCQEDSNYDSATFSRSDDSKTGPFYHGEVIQLTHIPEPCKTFMYQNALRALDEFTTSNAPRDTCSPQRRSRTYGEDFVVDSDEDRKNYILSSLTNLTEKNGILSKPVKKDGAAQPNKDTYTVLPSTVHELDLDDVARKERAKSLPAFGLIHENYKPAGKTLSSAVNLLKLKIRGFQENQIIPPKSSDDRYSKDEPISTRSKKSDETAESDSGPEAEGNIQSSAAKFESPGTPTRCSTKINLKIRNPGFERVVTPQVLFKTKAPFTCELCEETFSDFESFHEHGAKVHRRYICSYCGKVFTSRPNRERHIRYHTGDRPYKCELCSMSFLRGDDLKYHRTTKHSDVKPFMCAACQTSFSLPKDLEKHLKIYPDHKL